MHTNVRWLKNSTTFDIQQVRPVCTEQEERLLGADGGVITAIAHFRPPHVSISCFGFDSRRDIRI